MMQDVSSQFEKQNAAYIPAAAAGKSLNFLFPHAEKDFYDILEGQRGQGG
ncbi:MAG: hypothetical protein Q4C22_05235 [Bacillota bacterium]|nr:hypothetical protein [Bacillota bacterium]